MHVAAVEGAKPAAMRLEPGAAAGLEMHAVGLSIIMIHTGSATVLHRTKKISIFFVYRYTVYRGTVHKIRAAVLPPFPSPYMGWGRVGVP